ncbi:DJ-1 family glyoxalase III [Ketobacter sp.]|uniref:DJ-1 family glyoxalase III n=1 Tax=Ketobacter sp. TaxID=2083498 RepID=UPI000F2A0714|nr:DJ-1 family glyoxalase III [Ketobacter sp.]RLU01137.1 MAG: DJ-1/PfpI family protein [Ketobacter sp.]
MPAKTALVPIADGSEDIETVCIIDVLRRADVEVTVASVMPEGRLEICAARRTRILADAHIDTCADREFDLIALPGGLPGAEHLRDCPTLLAMLQRQQASGRWFTAICASPALVFAHHGLERALSTTAHPGFTQQLTHFDNQRVVVDQNCITSQGPGTALEFALALVEALLGPEKRAQVAAPMVL